MSALHDPAGFDFVSDLEADFPSILAEVESLEREAFQESLDSLTTVSEPYDERGWRYFDLHGTGDFAANRARLPRTAEACAAVPGLVNAGLSLFRPGTHLYPHHGEMSGVLRCHLALIVPEGDVGIRFGDETARWVAGRCLVFDDRVEHEAWNHAGSDRIVLIVTFRP